MNNSACSCGVCHMYDLVLAVQKDASDECGGWAKLVVFVCRDVCMGGEQRVFEVLDYLLASGPSWRLRTGGIHL